MSRLLTLLLSRSVCAAALILGGCAGVPRSYELTFWAGAGAENDPRVVRVSDHHACDGKIAIARVTSMPAPRSGALQGERVLEYTSDGRAVREWSLPVDHVVAAVSGDEIIVPLTHTTAGAPALAIASTGALRQVRVPSNGAGGRVLSCPDLPMFGRSAYLRCFEYHDVASGMARTIAYEGPCT